MKTILDIIPDLKLLWSETLGEPSIRIAIIDGEVNRNHPALKEANIEILETFIGDQKQKQNSSSHHGTHIASVIFGQHGRGLLGIAPNCTGLNLPVFFNSPTGDVTPCSQLDLARTISQAVDAGAQIINISGGELDYSGKAHSILEEALKYCEKRNVLVIAASGNDGCACLHIPASYPSVLVVGGMDEKGNPLEFSNWGEAYWSKGILAPGENIPGAIGKEETSMKTGTSYATAIVSGIAALLLVIQKRHSIELNPAAVREALLKSANGCGHWKNLQCQKLLKGRLNIKNAISLIQHKKEINMEELQNQVTEKIEMKINPIPMENEITNGIVPSCATNESSETGISDSNSSETIITSLPEKVKASSCGCGGGKSCSCGSKKTASNPIQLVYALGTLGFDLVSDSRQNSIAQHMNGNPNDPPQLLKYLEKNPWEAASITWILKLNATPIYAIQPYGAFATNGYNRLLEFLSDQLNEGADRISVSGYLTSQTRLMSGQIVPVIIPELRCMYNWNTDALVKNVLGKTPTSKTADKQAFNDEKLDVTNFLERVYYELQNLGTSPQDRAINYAATNALNLSNIFAEALNDNMQLDTIEVERSAICPLGTDCWNVVICFFDPEKQMVRARKCYRFTIDVSDVCPVMVGEVRSWYMR